LLQRGADEFTAYRVAFAVLAVPAAVAIGLLVLARTRFPNPENFEPEPATHQSLRLHRPFILYIVGISLCAVGFIDFPLITMHLSKLSLVPVDTLPLIYAGAMLVDAFAALIFGWMFDKIGMVAVMASTLLAAPFAAFVFGRPSLALIIVGVAMWGVGMGAQESILKAVVSTIVPKGSRSTGFGVFWTVWGVTWFLGSWLLGFLYDADRTLMIAISVGAQVAALPFFWLTARSARQAEG